MSEHQATIEDNGLPGLYKELKDTNRNQLYTRDFLKLADELAQKASAFNDLYRRTQLQEKLKRLEASKNVSVESKEQFEACHLHKQNLELTLGNFKPGETYKTMDVYGKIQEMKIPEIDDGSAFILHVNSYHNVAENWIQDEGWRSNDPKSKLLLYLKTNTLFAHDKKKTCAPANPPWPFFKMQWETGKWHDDNDNIWLRKDRFKENKWRRDEYYECYNIKDLAEREVKQEQKLAIILKNTNDKVKELVMKNSKSFGNIDKILCFGLGGMDIVRPRSFFQHLIACTIRNTLNEQRISQGEEPKVTVIAQDPLYCEICKDILRDELDIQARTDWHALKLVDQNTFVITLGADAPLRQMIIDTTLDLGWPAAILSREFSDDHLAGMYEKDWTTLNLRDYRAKCAVHQCNDDVDVLGMTMSKFEQDYSTAPALLPEGKFKDKTIELYRLEDRVNLYDAQLLVRLD